MKHSPPDAGGCFRTTTTKRLPKISRDDTRTGLRRWHPAWLSGVLRQAEAPPTRRSTFSPGRREAGYAQMIQPGDEIHLGAGQRFRVLDVVPFEDETDTSVGMLKVEAS
jgi:hypothetical protein